MVRAKGLEPPRDCSHWVLNPARLPFRHARTCQILPDLLLLIEGEMGFQFRKGGGTNAFHLREFVE